MENSNKIMKVAASYGLVSGFVMVVLMIINYAAKIPFMILCAYIAVIVYTTVSYREKYSGGTISYGKSLLFGILVSGFTFILLGIFVYMMISFYPDEYRELFNTVMENMKAQGFETAGVTENMIFNPITWITTYLFIGLFAGLTVSAITSIFTKKN
jgi:lysylphosphatidylglycerol synthetase-like protein (DUF2156 family)